MKTRPIPFNSEMVRAVLSRRKTQTRRVVRPQPVAVGTSNLARVEWHGEPLGWMPTSPSGKVGIFEPVSYNCPYGQPGDQEWQSGMPPSDGVYHVKSFDKPVHLRRFLPENYPGEGITPGLLWGWDESDDPESIEVEGLTLDTIRWKRLGDRLWVRETWAALPIFDSCKPLDTHRHRPLLYRADNSIKGEFSLGKNWFPADFGKWRPSIFMPRWASRIMLEVTGVRVERVQNISHQDALAGGIDPDAPCNDYGTGSIYVDTFAALWDSTNSKRGFGWSKNPWVWVVEFRLLKGGG